MTSTDLNITTIMADTMGLPVYHTVRKSRVYYDTKGERVPENWLPDGDCIIIRHGTRESLEKWLKGTRQIAK